MKIHFIGIGGIGVSALAQYYLAMGHQVSGSDLALSEIIDLLRSKGAEIFIGKHKRENLTLDVKLVVHSPAVKRNNPELSEARRKGIAIQSYPRALGELTKQCFTIAVCGTHGKSTTAAMLALILIKAGLDPTVIIGTKLREFGNSNFRMGNARERGARGIKEIVFLVIEADEWQASFLHYWPEIIVLTNIEREHLDYYKDLNHILKTYKKFVSHLPKDGFLIVNKDDKAAHRMASSVKRHMTGIKCVYYSVKQRGAQKLKKLLKVPGMHNVSNALAAFSAIRYGIRYRKIPVKTIYQALSEYKGSWRRFEAKKLEIGKRPSGESDCGRPGKLKIIHDYAHHPTEIEATLRAAREKWPKKTIWAVFQPHQHQRTFYLFRDFIRVFREAPVDKLIITDIYDVAGREKKAIKEKISAEKLANAANKKNIIYVNKNAILDYLKANIKGGGVMVIVMGAGDIYQLFS